MQAYEVLSLPRYPLPLTIYEDIARGEDKGDQRQLSNDSSPARANGPENRHMSDGDGVCGGGWNIYNLTVIYNLTMCGGRWNI